MVFFIWGNKKELQSSQLSCMVVSAGKSLHKIDNKLLKTAAEINLQQIEAINNEVNRLHDLLEVKYKLKRSHM